MKIARNLKILKMIWCPEPGIILRLECGADFGK